jgi:hypothetical protein
VVGDVALERVMGARGRWQQAPFTGLANPGDRSMKLRYLLQTLLLAALALATASSPLAAQRNRFEVSCPAATCTGPLTGRVVLVLARAAEPEPRLAINMVGPPLFAVDVEQLAPGEAASFPADALGYPADLDELAP